MVTLIDRVLRSAKHEEQAYNSCKGMLHMCNEIPRHLVSEAAQMCIDANACKYSYFKKRSVRLRISTLHLLTEPVISQSMKTSEGGTAINERDII